MAAPVDLSLSYAGDYSNECSRASMSSCTSYVTSVDGGQSPFMLPPGGLHSGRGSLRSPRASQSPSNPLASLVSSGTPFAAIASGLKDLSLREDSVPLAHVSDASVVFPVSGCVSDEAGRAKGVGRVSEMGTTRSTSSDSIMRRSLPRRMSQLSRVQESVVKEGEPEVAAELGLQ